MSHVPVSVVPFPSSVPLWLFCVGFKTGLRYIALTGLKLTGLSALASQVLGFKAILSRLFLANLAGITPDSLLQWWWTPYPVYPTLYDTRLPSEHLRS